MKTKNTVHVAQHVSDCRWREIREEHSSTMIGGLPSFWVVCPCSVSSSIRNRGNEFVSASFGILTYLGMGMGKAEETSNLFLGSGI